MRLAWVIAPSGMIHRAHTVELHPFTRRPAWVAVCNARNGHMGWMWELDEVHELDRRPQLRNVCRFCRATLSMGQPSNPRQLALLPED